MLCLRDPADETNDLGRKAIAIKHVQTTFKKLCYELDRNMTVNTRASLLGPLVGSSYMLSKDHRERLRKYGSKLSKQLKASLAAKAKLVRDRELEVETINQAVEENQQTHVAQEARDSEWQRQSEARNRKLAEGAERTAVLDHGNSMASILGMPSIEHTEVEKTK
jgi:non-canonical poly(A) RNA polymerase PAPD5/7